MDFAVVARVNICADSSGGLSVTLFHSDEFGHVLPGPKPARTPDQRKRSMGISILLGSLVLTVGLASVPSSYVIEQPGPFFDTLGTVSVNKVNDDGTVATPEPGKSQEKQKVPLISISGAAVFPTTGHLDLLTVSVRGNPQTTPSWLEVGAAWLDPSKAVVPLEAIYPQDESSDDRAAITTAQMVNSQHDAVAAALTNVGYNVYAGVQVQVISDTSPAKSILQVNDLILSVNGVALTNVQSLRDSLQANGTSKPVGLEIARNGVISSVEVTPVDNAGNVVLGIGVRDNYSFPFDVSIRLDDVGGPSAGMMFALGIIDKLTPGDLTSGHHFAGTGTITAAGVVGPIGGIRQKLYGAQRAGAQYFLAPADNCTEVRGHVPTGLYVFKVSTLSDALTVMDFVAMHGDQSAAVNATMHALPTCENG
jgi:PDZ domain-containing protein